MVDLGSQATVRVPYRAPRLAVGETISETVRVVGRALVPFYALSMIIALLGVPFAIYLAQVTASLSRATLRHEVPRFPPNILAQMGSVYVFQTLASLFVFAVISALALRYAERKEARFGESLKTAAMRFVPMLITAIVFYVLMVVGFALFVVPGIIVGAMYGLAPTLAVVERKGPFASLSRSAELTRANRWRCVAATIVLLLVPGLVIGVADAIVGAAFDPRLKLYASAFGNFLILPIIYVFPAVLVQQLRIITEGSARSGMAEVF